MSYFIHKLAYVEPNVKVGDGTKIWAFAQVREGAVIGANCVIGSHAFIDTGVSIGYGCKIENGAKIFSPAILEEYVFVGPGAVIANDRHPSAANSSWKPQAVTIRHHAAIGANAVIVPPCVIGLGAVIGAGTVVTRDVHEMTTLIGEPARPMIRTV